MPTTHTARWIRFLGSMNLAVTLLVILAVASVIGTVLQQNQAYPSYEIKFGSFWFETFRALGLYDVYATGWFLFILAFLMLSTMVCIFRNTPGFLRELRHFRENIQETSLRLMGSSKSVISTQSAETIQQNANQIFAAQGYQFRTKQDETHRVIAARKGSSHYWGYWLTHIGMLVILAGGLIDYGRLPLLLGEWRGKLVPETRNLPTSEIPAQSFVSANNYSFRGSVDVPEGQSANVIFLPIKDGYYVQRLPFDVELKKFRVQHYSTGQPKSFESDLIIHDRDNGTSFAHTISVNHPLTYKGVAIYQANFGDGGSEVKLKFNPLYSDQAAKPLDGKIFESYQLDDPKMGKLKLELTEFRLFNIIPIPDKNGKDHQHNVGPSITFKLRNEAGEAIEYTNYMAPVPLEGKNYIISGMRAKPADPLRYLHIPLDRKSSATGFLTFLHDLQNAELVRTAATASTTESLKQMNNQNPDIQTQVIESMVKLTQTFAKQGFDGITADIAARFPAEKRDAVNEAFMKVLNASLRATFIESMKRQGMTELTEADWVLYDDSLSAMANLPFYGSPWYVQLESFKQIQASGLQMTRSPGQNIVYLGSIMLAIGVFFMFYVAQRRIWVWIKPTSDASINEVIVAGSSNRHPEEFQQFLAKVQQALQLPATPARSE